MVTDITDPVTRSRMMSGIKGKNTQPELILRRALHAKGFRFRLHDKALSGKPDMVLAKWNAVIFVHGCFWHMHSCPAFRLPGTRTDFWLTKLKSNVDRDSLYVRKLQFEGWRVAIVWECSIRKALKTGDVTLINELTDWLQERITLTIEL
jgi:DNA mismatch endonuclease (patch repair protein)